MTQTNLPSTPVATSKTAALSRILNCVPKGYVHYISGQCPVDKAVRLAKKFHDLYGIGCSPAQRISRKNKGLANAVLTLYRPPLREDELDTVPGACLAPVSALVSSPDRAPYQHLAAAQVSWLLLATAGAGSVHEQESLRLVTEKPHLVFLGYELVRYQQRGQLVWTFRRTKEEMAEWYSLLASQLNQRQHGAVAKTLLRISHQPGFHGVRQQSFALAQFAVSRGYAGELPKLFFVQKISHGEALLLV
ncbi:MAG: hypothetical protein ABI040_12465 [Rhodoferax sp.]